MNLLLSVFFFFLNTLSNLGDNGLYHFLSSQTAQIVGSPLSIKRKEENTALLAFGEVQ